MYMSSTCTICDHIYIYNTYIYVRMYSCTYYMDPHTY